MDQDSVEVLEESSSDYLTREDFYTKRRVCHDCNDNCMCVMNDHSYTYNKNIDKLFDNKEKFGFTDIKYCTSSGMITFVHDKKMYYYGRGSGKCREKGTNKWFYWNVRYKIKSGKKRRVKGKCISCDCNINVAYTRCYHCFVDYKEKESDESIKRESIYS